jgi:hypothetical protein
MEAERGLDALEDLLTPGSFTADLALRRPVFLTATAEATAAAGPEIEGVLKGAAQRLLAPLPKSAPAWIRSLAHASESSATTSPRMRCASHSPRSPPWVVTP